MSTRHEKELDALVVAFLLDEGAKQNEIAERLGLNAPEVNRLKARAKQRGWLVESKRYALSDGVKRDAETMKKIRARLAPEELIKLMQTLAMRNGGTAGPDIRVFPTLYEGTTEKAWRERVKHFSRAAAAHLTDMLLGSSGIIGVSWGNTLAEAVKAVEDSLLPKRRAAAIQFIPLSGEPLGGFPTRFSSSSLAAQLDLVFNRRSDHSLSLGSVPALYPRELSTKDIEACRRLNGYVEGYRKIFGEVVNGSHNGHPLISQVDTILTSVGNHDMAFRYGTDDQFLKSAGFERDEISTIVIGDICGVPLPLPDLDRSKKAVLHAICERWTGIREEHVKACAEKASDGRSRGTIVVAIGKNKAATVHECVRRGLVNHLVIDQDLADELEDLSSGLHRPS